MNVPRYLLGYDTAYVHDPRAAASEWFGGARFGLFLHYGLYSLLGGVYQGRSIDRKGSEWIRWAAPIPYDAYARLADRFTAECFDAEAICDLALDAGMKYVNLTTQHHDGFCLWDTATTDFSSVNTPAKRDLVAELADACDRKGLGLFLYYSHGRDWWHPHSPDNGEPSCRPDCPEDAGRFATGDDYNLDEYLDFAEAQILELCRNYRPVAGIWLDGIGGFTNMADGVRRSRCAELYDKIRATSPHILVAYKQGLTFAEDFYAPERHIREGTLPSDGRPYEICTTLQPSSWGYKAADDGKHHGPDWVMEQLEAAGKIPANLLLNTGPTGDGAIPEEDVTTLREVGQRLREAASRGQAPPRP
ncbi:MAG: alpha-L-fucosidase [Phycisphaeraceae bacterium]|nr:alpha-L-fucosidase [Phycisphaeraceae bacterium]